MAATRGCTAKTLFFSYGHSACPLPKFAGHPQSPCSTGASVAYLHAHACLPFRLPFRLQAVAPGGPASRRCPTLLSPNRGRFSPCAAWPADRLLTCDKARHECRRTIGRVTGMSDGLSPARLGRCASLPQRPFLVWTRAGSGSLATGPRRRAAARPAQSE
jgi:hypothetical protein